jgi:hypothetical protein
LESQSLVESAFTYFAFTFGFFLGFAFAYSREGEGYIEKELKDPWTD